MQPKPKRVRTPKKIGNFHFLGSKHAEIPNAKISRRDLLRLGFTNLKLLRLRMERIYMARHPEDSTMENLEKFFIVVRKGGKLKRVYWANVNRAVNFSGKTLGFGIPRRPKTE